MRLFTVSDIHIDYKENRDWLKNISSEDYLEDVLCLAGDISHHFKDIEWCFQRLQKKFHSVIFIEGNHDIWFTREKHRNSIDKLNMIYQLAEDTGIQTGTVEFAAFKLVAISGWYDYSFGQPQEMILKRWGDFKYCKWPAGMNHDGIVEFFKKRNQEPTGDVSKFIVTYSHFMPRIDLLPMYLRTKQYPYSAVLGGRFIEETLRKHRPMVHIYGHSHINVEKKKDSVLYVNNALGYPSESQYTRRTLYEIPVSMNHS